MKSTLCILVLAWLYIPCQSQSVVASGGQSASNTVMQASATIGEAVIGSSADTGVTANQGFQQPLQSDITTSIDMPHGQKVDVLLSPNPFIDRVKLTFSSEVFDIQLQVYSTAGALVRSQKYPGARSQLEIALADLQSGQYYLYLVDIDGSRLGTLPLIKL